MSRLGVLSTALMALALCPAAFATPLDTTVYPATDVRVSGIADGRAKARDWGLAVGVEADRPWSGVRLGLSAPLDVTGFRTLVAAVTNLTDAPLTLKFHAKPVGKESHFLYGEATLPPRRRRAGPPRSLAGCRGGGLLPVLRPLRAVPPCGLARQDAR